MIRARDQSEVTTAEPAAEADRAMAWLQRAVAAGYKDAAQLATDKDLGSLRERPDFQSLLASLDTSHAKNPK